MTDPIPSRLPLLDALVDERAGAARPLAGATAILVQHQTGTLVAMVAALARLGLDPERCFVIDIPYSAHPRVRAGLCDLGVPAGNFARSDYRPGMPFTAYQSDRAAELYLAVRARLSATDPLLLLDDGGYLTHALCLHGAPRGVTGVVEQTVFGIRKLREDPAIAAATATVPVVNVAECRPKKDWEAAFLGDAIAHALARHPTRPLSRMRRGRTLLLGYGAIGAAVACALRSEHGAGQLVVADPDEAARARAQADGFPAASHPDPQHAPFDVVIGCSGRRAFRPADAPLLSEGAILASGSSGAIEFGTDEPWAVAAASAAPGIHDTLHADMGGRRVVILNGGFPVDFDGSLETAPPHLMQLTRALMVGGAMQAMATTGGGGITALAADFVEWIERRFAGLTGFVAG